jgi:SAM-dependent MidA family methyltransferase
MSLPVRDEFEPITRSAPLEAELRERIERAGPLTFRSYMEAALYHPRHGYYATHPGATSRGGDYLTSPEVHPIFGSLVAKQLREAWERMDRPSTFDVVEPGAGSGLLARDVLAWAGRSDAEFAGALRYHIVEPLAALRDLQRRTIDEAGIPEERVAWCDALPRRVSGVVLSNELVDAFPVHRVVLHDGELREVYVAWRDGAFVDEPGPPSTPELAAYFDALGLLPGEGCYAEVNLDAVRWMREIAAALERGYVLTFDYGYEASELYAPWRRDGTLLCFYRHAAGSDPFQRLGKQDMTSSVDFSTLPRAGEDAGLRTLGMTDQADFLVRLGIGAGLTTQQDRMEEYFARRSVVMALVDPARLGRVKVLLQGRGVPDEPLAGFRDE